jgi:hypothetical protein
MDRIRHIWNKHQITVVFDQLNPSPNSVLTSQRSFHSRIGYEAAEVLAYCNPKRDGQCVLYRKEYIKYRTEPDIASGGERAASTQGHNLACLS